jgi:hypothetical protein
MTLQDKKIALCTRSAVPGNCVSAFGLLDAVGAELYNLSNAGRGIHRCYLYLVMQGGGLAPGSSTSGDNVANVEVSTNSWYRNRENFQLRGRAVGFCTLPSTARSSDRFNGHGMLSAGQLSSSLNIILVAVPPTKA